MIPYGHQSIDDDDIAAVVAVLKGDWLTQGPAVDTFEAAIVEATGARFAVAFTNGTAALHAACAVAGLGPGDLVVTSPLSFVASANCARYVGASVGFVDIDPETMNIDLPRVPAAADAVVAVHYAGLPVDLTRLAHRPRVVIEDAAHAIGALTPDGPVGNCARSDLCCFSFHPVKTITTAEGGAVTTNSYEWADALRRFRSHGTVRVPDEGGWAYDVVELAYNYRLTDMQAALGSSQLAKLGTFVERRNRLAAAYRAGLAELAGAGRLILPPAAPPGWRHAYHLFAVQVPPVERRRIYDELRGRGVGAQVHYRPIHQHSTFASLGLGPGSFPAAERAGASVLSLPLFPGLRDDELETVVDALRTVC